MGTQLCWTYMCLRRAACGRSCLPGNSNNNVDKADRSKSLDIGMGKESARTKWLAQRWHHE